MITADVKQSHAVYIYPKKETRKWRYRSLSRPLPWGEIVIINIHIISHNHKLVCNHNKVFIYFLQATWRYIQINCQHKPIVLSYNPRKGYNMSKNTFVLGSIIIIVVVLINNNNNIMHFL